MLPLSGYSVRLHISGGLTVEEADTPLVAIGKAPTTPAAAGAAGVVVFVLPFAGGFEGAALPRPLLNIR